MLRKLLKYEYRATFLPPVIICAVLALMSVSQTVIALFSGKADSAVFVITYTLSFVFNILLTSGAITTVYVLTAIRFYSHIYGNQGYLTLMLPASRTKLHLSKYIVSLTWIALCSIVGFLGITLPFFALEIDGVTLANALELDWQQLTAHDLVSFAIAAVQTLAVYTISSASMLSTLYCSVSLGQLFRKGRILASILIFCGIYFIQYIINMTISFIWSFALIFTNTNITISTDYSFIITGIVSLVFFILQYIITDRILKKKVNLQ